MSEPRSKTKQNAQKIQGEITRVFFPKDGKRSQGDFAVVVVAYGAEQIKVSGTLRNPQIGQSIECFGHIEEDEKYGRSFKASIIQEVLPHDIGAIERFLVSTKIDGLDARAAMRLVSRFGEETLDVLDLTPYRLAEVSEIPEDVREQIAGGWAKYRAEYHLGEYLSSISLDPGLARKVIGHMGHIPSDIVDSVRRNPYVLSYAKDIGFKKADEIALSMGIRPDAPVRLQAAISKYVNDVYDKGNTACMRDSLIAEAARLLQVRPAQVEVMLDGMEAQRELVVPTTCNGKRAVSLPRIEMCERGIADDIKRISMGAEPACHPNEIPKTLALKNGRTLHEKQVDAVRMGLTERVSILVGGPGMGKTTIVDLVSDGLERKGKNLMIVAPTGRAAKRAHEATNREACTIHKMLGARGDNQFEYNEQNRLPYDAYIMDETSMTDVEIFHAFLRAVPSRATIMLIGDTDQLQSVRAGNVLADLLGSGRIPFTRLTEVFRQGENSSIVDGSRAIIQGLHPSYNDEDFRYIATSNDERSAKAIIEIAYRMVYRDGIDLNDLQIVTPMHGEFVGTKELNRLVQEKFNPSKGRNEIEFRGMNFKGVFREGDRVMQMRNNYSAGIDLMNGDMGTVLRVDRHGEWMALRFDDREVQLKAEHFDDLNLAYAVTVHKSQGGEFPHVIMPLSMHHARMLNRNLLYTAVTRAKDRIVLVGDERAVDYAIQTRPNMVRLTSLCDLVQSRLIERKRDGQDVAGFGYGVA